MRDRLCAALSKVHAGEELRERTLAVVYPRARRRRRAPLVIAAVCLVTVLGVFGGVFFTPASAIGIDVNPALELKINRFDLVVGIEGLNEDGRQIAQDSGLMFTEYSQAVDALVARLREYLDEGREMSIVVKCDDQSRSEEMLARVESCVGGEKNITCCAHGRGGASEDASGSSDSSSQCGHGQGHGKRHRYRGGTE